MRIACAAVALFCFVGSAAAQPTALIPDADLPYSACGDLAALWNNLTGASDPSPRSGAILRRLGVRCVGPAVAPRIRQRY
jgi:hypothetical protein